MYYFKCVMCDSFIHNLKSIIKFKTITKFETFNIHFNILYTRILNYCEMYNDNYLSIFFKINNIVLNKKTSNFKIL